MNFYDENADAKVRSEGCQSMMVVGFEGSLFFGHMLCSVYDEYYIQYIHIMLLVTGEDMKTLTDTYKEVAGMLRGKL